MEIRRTYPDPSWDGAGPVAGGLQGRFCSVADPNPLREDQLRKRVKVSVRGVSLLYGLLHTWLSKDCSLWSTRALQSHSERPWWSR